MTSRRMSATCLRGGRERNGFCRTIWTFLRQRDVSCFEKPKISRPSYVIFPEEGGSRCRIIFASVLLPEPLSPKIPTISPLATVRLIFFRTSTRVSGLPKPGRIQKSFSRSEIDSSINCLLLLQILLEELKGLVA